MDIVSAAADDEDLGYASDTDSFASFVDLSTIDADVGTRTRRFRLRAEARNRNPQPWRHFWLPCPRVSRTKPAPISEGGYDGGLSDTDSEDCTPRLQRLAARDTKANSPGSARRRGSGTHQGHQQLQEMASTSEKDQDPGTAPHSCIHCARLSFDLRKQEADFIMPATYSFEGEYGLIQGRDTGFTFADAKGAASDGCVLFAFVVRMVSIWSADEAKSPSWRYRHNGIKSIFTMRARRGEAAIGFKVDLAGERDAEGRSEIFAGKFGLYTVPGTKPLHEFLGHWLPPNLNPNSQLSFTHARSWIEKCSREHSECIAFNLPFMPARVLEISHIHDSLRVRLVSNPKLAPYATLSYCWGGDQPAKTIASLLTSYEREIPLSTLPCTIQDALAVVYGIGFRYIWIDAMCIVQDDEDDVTRQISQMHQIYRGSLFTIISATAETSRDRFLQPRTQHRPTKLEARLDDNVFGSLIAMPVPEVEPINPSSLPKYRVFSRGWTFQEGLLSTRILAYGERELVYQCHQSRHRDGGIEYVTSGELLVDEGSQIFNHIDPGNRRLGGPPHPLGWGRSVSTYTKRQLTVEDDKLLAIAAIAEEYSQTKPVTEYYAGMWKEDFLAQCLWRVKPFVGGSRPANYRAPSWSWASIDGEITYRHKKYDLQPGRPECTDYTYTCSLLGDVHTTLYQGQNRFGKVEGGFMRIRAKMRAMMWNTAPARGPGEKKSLPRGTEDTRPDFAIDCVEEWPENDIVRLLCMEVCTYIDLEKGMARGEGLLLVEEPGGLGRMGGLERSLAGLDVFKRVGQVDFHAGWYDDGEFPYEWKEIVII